MCSTVSWFMVCCSHQTEGRTMAGLSWPPGVWLKGWLITGPLGPWETGASIDWSRRRGRVRPRGPVMDTGSSASLHVAATDFPVELIIVSILATRKLKLSYKILSQITKLT